MPSPREALPAGGQDPVYTFDNNEPPWHRENISGFFTQTKLVSRMKSRKIQNIIRNSFEMID